MVGARRRRRVTPAVSIVTGGASGIGRALAVELAARGGHVVVADVDERAASDVVADLGPAASTAVVDVTDAAALDDVVARTVTRHGRLDLMVNNAGIGLGGLVEELTDRHWAKALDVNLRGVVNGVHAAYPVMQEQGSGRILNTASLAGLVPVPGMLPYTTTKHAVVGLSLGLRAEAAPHGIRVSVLCPGFVDTPILDNLYEPPPSLGSVPRETIERFQPRLLSAERTAARAMRGLERDQAVIAVGLTAHVLWRAARVSPGLMSRVAGLGRAVQSRQVRRAVR
jgi:NAD(P)-dependent dehydrogenase (short-subunit alcohol dehydrogenase family)